MTLATRKTVYLKCLKHHTWQSLQFTDKIEPETGSCIVCGGIYTQKSDIPFGTPLDMDATELHTWFERDRAHVELRSKLDDSTIIEWWDEAVGEAVEDGFLPQSAFMMGRLMRPEQLHTAAYNYAKQMNMLPRVPLHYIYGSGEHGCLYDSGPHYAETLQDAVEGLAQTFELGRTRKARLKKNLYLELSTADGAAYCEITPCKCGNPLEHQEND
jgi:hypothetical protein